VGVLRELATEAAPLGVTLGLEICNRYETNVVNTARDACGWPTTSARTTW
jgi:D-psicose/D-tagatose/L-ribulose 3-epimerase